MPLFKNGTTTMQVSKKNYLRIDSRLLYKKEPCDSALERILDTLERYEQTYGKFPQPPE